MVKTTNQYLVCVVSSSLFENVGLTCIPHVLQIHVCRVFFCLRVFKASLFLFDVHFVVRRTLAKSPFEYFPFKPFMYFNLSYYS